MSTTDRPSTPGAAPGKAEPERGRTLSVGSTDLKLPSKPVLVAARQFQVGSWRVTCLSGIALDLILSIHTKKQHKIGWQVSGHNLTVPGSKDVSDVLRMEMELKHITDVDIRPHPAVPHIYSLRVRSSTPPVFLKEVAPGVGGRLLKTADFTVLSKISQASKYREIICAVDRNKLDRVLPVLYKLHPEIQEMAESHAAQEEAADSPPFICRVPDCKYTVSTKKYLHEHLRNKHNMETNPPIVFAEQFSTDPTSEQSWGAHPPQQTGVGSNLSTRRSSDTSAHTAGGQPSSYMAAGRVSPIVLTMNPPQLLHTMTMQHSPTNEACMKQSRGRSTSPHFHHPAWVQQQQQQQQQQHPDLPRISVRHNSPTPATAPQALFAAAGIPPSSALMKPMDMLASPSPGASRQPSGGRQSPSLPLGTVATLPPTPENAENQGVAKPRVTPPQGRSTQTSMPPRPPGSGTQRGSVHSAGGEDSPEDTNRVMTDSVPSLYQVGGSSPHQRNAKRSLDGEVGGLALLSTVATSPHHDTMSNSSYENGSNNGGSTAKRRKMTYVDGGTHNNQRTPGTPVTPTVQAGGDGPLLKVSESDATVGTDHGISGDNARERGLPPQYPKPGHDVHMGGTTITRRGSSSAISWPKGDFDKDKDIDAHMADAAD